MIDLNDAMPQSEVSNIMEHPTVRRARILNALQLRIRDFVAYIYPRAAGLKSDTARIGDVSGKPGSSLAICLAPIDKAGLWKEFGSGNVARDGGDVFDLYAVAHNMDRQDFMRILDGCDKWLGGTPPAYMKQRQEKEAAKPIEPDPIEKEVAVFPYLSVSGEHLFDVVRFDLYRVDGTPIVKDGGKQAKVYKPRQLTGRLGYPSGPRPLYRLPDIDKADEIVFCEGEKCADALHSMGRAATSAPGGADTKLDAIDWRPLAGKQIILWPDNDTAGLDFMGRVRTVLEGIGCKVRSITIPADAPAKWDAFDAVAEARDLTSLLDVEAKPPAHGLTGHWLDEIAYKYEPELVEGLIPTAGVGVIFGPSSAGKSFVTVDWAVRIASGGKVLDRFTEASGVLYFAAEGQGGLAKRLVAARKAHGLDDVVLPFNYLPALLDLSRAETGDVERLCLYAEDVSREMKSRGAALRIIVIDTLAAAAPSADENTQKDMGPIMLAFHRMANRLNAVVLLVAHTGKDVNRGLRGWSGIRANADFAIECRVDKDELTGETTRRSLWLEKAKDGRDGFTLADYSLRITQLGAKRSGDPDTTCWVQYAEPAPMPAGGSAKSPTLYSGPQKRILQYLSEGAKTTIEVATHLGVDRSNAGKKLRSMEKDGAIFSRSEGAKQIWLITGDVLPTDY